MRKYFKDTGAEELQEWGNIQVSKFLSSKRAILGEGIFVIDGTHIIVPDNKNYEKAQYVPLDSNHKYVDVAKLSEEQAKKFKPILCYKMVNLLHLLPKKNYFTFMGTKISGGRAHDKVLGKKLVEGFVSKVGKGKIKLLILGACPKNLTNN